MTKRKRSYHLANLAWLVPLLTFSALELLGRFGVGKFTPLETVSGYVYEFEDWMPWHTGELVVSVILLALWLHLVPRLL